MNVVIMYLQYLDWAGPLMLQCDTPSLRMESHQHRYGKEVIGKKKKRENYTNVQLNISFPSWLFTRNLQIWIKKFPWGGFFSDQGKTLFILFYFFSFWEKYRWKGWTFGQIVQCDFPWVEYKFLIHILKFLL